MPQIRYPITFKVTAEDAARRLDQFLAARLPDVSRARVQQVIEQQSVLVNDGEEKPSYKLRLGDRVTVLGPAERSPLRAMAEEIPLNIVYEDNDLAVVNKPAGMMVHAGAGATESESNRGTLVNALLHRFGTLSEVGGELRPGIVHRLDRETSGLIIVAKNDASHRSLGEQFASRTVKKKYLALVHGNVPKDNGTIDAPISRDTLRRIRMTTRRTGGREAVSHWKVLRRIESAYGKFTLVEVKIDTGRTHQIRVHMASIGHPVVGDTLYGAPREIKPLEPTALRGKKPAKPRRAARPKSVTSADAKPGIETSRNAERLALTRNFLHAAAVEFLHPRTTERLSFSCPLPQELEWFLKQLECKQPEQSDVGASGAST